MRRPTLRSILGPTACALALLLPPGSGRAIDLADAPLFATSTAPGNLLLALSVEWPTASTPAYFSTTAYSAASTFLGYFDPDKCYRYVYNLLLPADSYFTPQSAASGHACSSNATTSLWSGNWLNWASAHTLDAFRWVMTGGTRKVDSSSATILQKTYHDGSGGSGWFPNKTTTADIAGATPFNWASVGSRVYGGGYRIWVTGSADLNSTTPPLGTLPYTGQNSYNLLALAMPGLVYELYVQVKVCDSSVGVESNCQLYPNGQYKPEGLIQQYAQRLRFSAFGYLNDGAPSRDGGVMRARMKYVAPTQPVPGSTSVSNGAAEWDASTGVMTTNPDAADATATAAYALAQSGYSVSVTNSGVMNYLNKFGQFATGNRYKYYDPVSELYYAGLRYYRNLGNVNEYSQLSGAASAADVANWVDGFPVITSWDDPIAYSCQKNFILGIGDVNAWNDANLYGSTIRGTSEPAMPAQVSADSAINVKTATDMVGTLEGIFGLGSGLMNGYRQNSYFMAGLAYDAHTRDQRSDLAGSQTVSTYWVDVMEGQSYLSKNQYWLAAKYGGFTVPSGFSPYSAGNGSATLTTSMWNTTGDLVGSDLRPDNYFAGGQVEEIRDSLSKAFARIVSEASASTTTAFSSASPNEASSGSLSYAAGYEPQTWSGSLVGSSVAYAGDGTPTLTAVWNATTLLDATPPANRRIVTCCTSGGAALPFTAASLTAATLSSRTYWASFAAVPGVATASQSQANYLAFLRGDRSNEQSAGGPYRTRSHVLGDIVNAKLTVVGAPNATYYEASNPGYNAFKRSYAGRRPVVYAGANDGMLHAFDGSATGSSAGSELFAYIPSFVYGSASSAADSGLAALGNPAYDHRYYVDATPQVFDLDFNRAGTSSTPASSDWRSLLIGALGKGGKGYFAIDVTDPAAWTTETAVAGQVLWEFTDSRLGYSYGDARVVKTAKWGWVALIPSGYNNADGRGYLFIVNPKTGALLEAIATGTGSTAAPLNLAYVTAFVPDLTSFTATAAYAADLQGNLWRFDLSAASGSYPAPTKIATLSDASGNAQPVSSPVRVMVDPATAKRYVLVGTGRLLADSDSGSTQRQSFYAIIDGTAAAPYTTATLPSGVSFPVTRGKLNANSSLLSGIGSSPAQPMGWYYDLGTDATSGIAERITIAPTVNYGVVGVAVNLPDSKPCTPTPTSRIFAVNFATGKTALTDSSGTAIAMTTFASGLASDLAFKNISGRIRLISGRSNGQVDNLPGSFSSAAGLRRINWREVPTIN
ncbi:MAG TPA: PilC/PilY family type IV pilus protein [Burkholderiaceae bacterium]|nr:PilC/PilY family type IV pilus protein [Burkholderiaceae bacterium]HMY98786.1 PilC/PilY family type IV pilus protein [Burkholderiaceae bacterium]HNB43390.1 PilC/PilY family type IV pilus protein [Burkholderiaceae bacterium]HNG78918.1 PilC/PilY family type IV pilus protein [Burkholderiaceae bacterium]